MSTVVLPASAEILATPGSFEKDSIFTPLIGVGPNCCVFWRPAPLTTCSYLSWLLYGITVTL
jgi:hypothetical protein